MKSEFIAKLGDIVDDNIIEVTIKGHNIILFKHDNNIKAFQGNCPHENTPLAMGFIENGKIVCPMHKWKFSCNNGKEFQDRACLKSYPVYVEGDDILIKASFFEKEDEESGIRSIDQLPSPKGDILIGNLREFNKNNKHQIIEKWAKECGRLFHINVLGKKILISCDPEFNKSIFKQRPEKFRRHSKIDEAMRSMRIIGLSNVEGDVWRKHRKITSEAFKVKNIKSNFPFIGKVTNRLYKKLTKQSIEGGVIDIQKELKRYVVDITTAIAFGYEMNTLEGENNAFQNHLEKFFPMIERRLSAPLPLWRYIKLKKDKELDIASKGIEDKVTELIQISRKKIQEFEGKEYKPSNILEAVLLEQSRHGNFSDKEVYGSVLTVILGGEDTTSYSISWAIFYLSQHPHIVEKIRKEANEIYKKDSYPKTMDLVDKLEYTEAVAREVFRIKSVAPMLYHEALEDVVINNLMIKKNTTIISQTQVPQKSKDYFTSPNKFIPERWMDNSGCPVLQNHDSKAVMTFGSGPRYCPGAYQATLLMKLAISTICKNFDITLISKPKEVKEIMALSMQPDDLLVKLKVDKEVLKSKVLD